MPVGTNKGPSFEGPLALGQWIEPRMMTSGVTPSGATGCRDPPEVTAARVSLTVRRVTVCLGRELPGLSFVTHSVSRKSNLTGRVVYLNFLG
jgi:hypothetical protein